MLLEESFMKKNKLNEKSYHESDKSVHFTVIYMPS